jgi:predicted N-acetyltransferase YhbS
MAPNGDYVSHCGMWYDKKSKSALVEPVATEPAYQRMGLGKAAVLEGIKHCGKLGVIRAFVGSSQQFYYNIGFRPYATSTWWKEKKKTAIKKSVYTLPLLSGFGIYCWNVKRKCRLIV